MADEFEYDVFMSFASADEALVRPVWEHLSRSGLRVFWSEAALKNRLGESWFDVVQHALERSRHCLWVCTPASLKSEWVKREYVAFYNNSYRAGTRRLLPVLADSCARGDLPFLLRDLQACRLGDEASLDVILELLGGSNLRSLHSRIAALEKENRALRAALDGRTEDARSLVGDPAVPDPAPSIPVAVTLDTAVDGKDAVVSPTDPSTAEAVRAWLDEIEAERMTGYGTGYQVEARILDRNSRQIFVTLQWALPEIPKGLLLATLQALLADEEELTRWKAMRMLTYAGFADVSALRQFWVQEMNPFCRELVLDALPNLAEDDGIAFALEISKDDGAPRLRLEAIKRLPAYACERTRHRIVTRLLDALGDTNDGVRAGACGALLEVDGTESIAAVAQLAIKDSNEEVRNAAIALVAAFAPAESFRFVEMAYARRLIGWMPYRQAVIRYIERFGSDPLLAQFATEPLSTSRLETEDLIRKCAEEVRMQRLRKA